MDRLTIFLLLISLSLINATPSVFTRKCESIKSEMCRQVGYNATAMPNFVGHELQQDAELQIQTFAPLIQYGCSSQLKLFLCSVYVPMCNEKVPTNIGPCRSLCQSVKDRCEPVLLEFGFHWPVALDCGKFPQENNRRHMCMEGPKELIDDPLSSKPTYNRPSNGIRPTLKPNTPLIPQVSDFSRTSLKPETQQHPKPYQKHQCSGYKFASQFVFISRISKCGQKCSSDILFSGENKTFAVNWLLFWSLICSVLTAFTIITFILDSSQFNYLERVIVILAFTYLIYGLGSLLRVIFGRSEVSCHVESEFNIDLLIQDGPDNILCTIVFVLLYYFWMSSVLWWLNLTIMWYLASGLNWSPEAIESKSSYFHVIAWIPPAIQTIAIVIMRVIDADELTGACFVGNSNSKMLLVFVIVPASSYVAIGLMFVICRCCSTYFCKQEKKENNPRIRHNSFRSSSSYHNPHGLMFHRQQFELEQFSRQFGVTPPVSVNNWCNHRGDDGLLHLRISFFTYFYLFAAIGLILTHLYEYFNRDSWYISGSNARPNVEIFMLKIFLQMVPGILSGLWIWSSKSPVAMWKKTFCRFGKSRVPSRATVPVNAAYT